MAAGPTAAYNNLDLSGGQGNAGERPERRLRATTDDTMDIVAPCCPALGLRPVPGIFWLDAVSYEFLFGALDSPFPLRDCAWGRCSVSIEARGERFSKPLDGLARRDPAPTDAKSLQAN